jgi:hypothetical protein
LAVTKFSLFVIEIFGPNADYPSSRPRLYIRDKAVEAIRAERRAGELLREMKERGERQRNRGDRKSKSSDTILISEAKSPQPVKLKDLGITPDQSSKWQQLANVPTEEFEQAVRGSGPVTND